MSPNCCCKRVPTFSLSDATEDEKKTWSWDIKKKKSNKDKEGKRKEREVKEEKK
jgi:hypothetical protein